MATHPSPPCSRSGLRLSRKVGKKERENRYCTDPQLTIDGGVNDPCSRYKNLTPRRRKTRRERMPDKGESDKAETKVNDERNV